MTVPTVMYKKVGSSGDTPSSEMDERLDQQNSPSRWSRVSTIVLSITTLVFGFQSLYLSFRLVDTCPLQPFERGYPTDWDPAKASIQLTKVTYTSAFRYNETSKGYFREFDPAEPKYIGIPTAEIDDAWGELLAGQYLVLSEEEANQLDNAVQIKGRYLAEVEVMHSLHCLNAIRKALHKDYYAVHDKHLLPEDLQRIHVDHCFEQLRQNIQCAADLTPVPLRPYGEEPNINLIGTPQVHTCRNWGVFRKWYTERGIAHGKVNSGGT